MLKCALSLVAIFFLSNTAFCQQSDTTIIYLKNDLREPRGFRQVATLDSADFIRVILPTYSTNDRISVQEFYKNGNLKLTAKYDKFYNRTGASTPDGDCVTYFETGKKKSITHYANGQKEGDEYLFYPDGSIYCNIKHIAKIGEYLNKIVNWECHDKKGTITCNARNGIWTLYDANFFVVLQGQVINGSFEGDWHGQTNSKDSTKYIYKFHRGLFVSGIGYDAAGKPYPFLKASDPPFYKKDAVVFMELVRSHLKTPRDKDGKKIDLNNAFLSFVIEKDGSLSDPQIIGYDDPKITDALKDALAKCKGWYPRIYYGIPLRSKITIPFKEIGEFSGNSYITKIEYHEDILGF